MFLKFKYLIFFSCEFSEEKETEAKRKELLKLR